MLSPSALAVAGAVALVGAVVQGVAGFGLNLLCAPLLVLVDPALVPVPVLLVATVQSGLGVAREHAMTDWRGVGWAVLGRGGGNVLGMLVVASLPLREFSLVVAGSVLVCVGLSVVSWRPTPTRNGLLLAGAASGAFGTTSAIGGPPMALIYQGERGPRVRATLSAYFLLGSITSLVTLGVAGRVEVAHLWAALSLLPFVVLGFVLSGPLRRFLDAGRVRPTVLVTSAVAAVLLAGRSLLG
ncbi:sulfite exporter TauE/SafE family protein [Streptoalloteichus hindustanus]|uniref:Probable membrane transporter protein n=1 Tax=Streptoalloteichus hindustanus TaxID=2017 RepID=A0A1M5LSH3_STRHI|nr:sulfite exporter TauE/SafE family protein [Streptoalloteichus hindustanus]SHG67569.1 hypothetical protein SAMN05444320_11230 [Streptoalloteichus hindustanus]